MLSSNLLATLAVLASSHQAAAQVVQGYRPVNVTCPSRSLLRNAGTNANNNQTVNPSEASYIANRRQNQVAPAFESFLANNLTGYDLSVLAPNASYWPTMGLAVSGGGYRAALVGAGTFQAFDGRNQSSVQAGTGGIMQLASYMAGLSGGSWFVGSLAINNMPSIQDLVLGSSTQQGWFLEYNLVLPDGVISIFDNQNYYDNIEARVDAKADAGFNTSITDAWSVALSYHFSGPNGTTADNYYEESATLHNTPAQWTGIRDQSSFSDHSMPFPVITACSRPPNYFPIALNQSTVYIPLNSTVYEFSPYEMGSYDPDLAHFVEADYLGTNLRNGQPYSSTSCVNGFANMGYMLGTSSSLFNAIVQTANATLLGLGDGSGLVESALDGLLANIGGDLRDSEDDLAIYPNSFQGINPGVFPRSGDQGLQLVDGGENGDNIPLDPLLVKARGVDTIIAIDGSADTNTYWPNATSLRSSYARAMTLAEGYQTLPYFPSAETFVSEGLNQRPTFFGCNASQAEISAGMPMIIYIPNTPLGETGYYTNVSTYTLEYSREDTQSFLNSMWNSQTRGYPQNGATRDEQYGACLACGIIERRRQAAGLARSDTCEQCLSRYCYDAAPADGGVMAAAMRAVPNVVYNNDALLHV